MQTVLSSTDWVLVIVATFLIGMGKGGLKGIDMLNEGGFATSGVTNQCGETTFLNRQTHIV